jgi:hypothetical protein
LAKPSIDIKNPRTLNSYVGLQNTDSATYLVSRIDNCCQPTCRFVPEKFEEIFKKHAHTRPIALTAKELEELLQENREPKDLAGW